MLQTDRALVAGDANGGAGGTGHGMRAQTERLNHADNAGDLGLSGIGIHDDEHKRASLFPMQWRSLQASLALPPHPRPSIRDRFPAFAPQLRPFGRATIRPAP